MKRTSALANNLSRIWNKIRYQLMILYLLDRLESLGILIALSYWTQEGATTDNAIASSNDFKDYSFEFFEREEMEIIGSLPERTPDRGKLERRLARGDKCFGAKHKGVIAAFNWLSFDGCDLRYSRIRFCNNEVYLYDMHTLKAFRGNDIAPYLRYRTYEALRDMGYRDFFSVTEYFNKPAIRFKKKIDAKFIRLRLHIEFFNKVCWAWTLREYS